MKLTAAVAAKVAAGRAVTAKVAARGAVPAAAAGGALQGAGRLLQRRRHRVRRDVEVLAQVLDALVGQEPAAETRHSRVSGYFQMAQGSQSE